jgi:hypothetical protein
MASVRFWRQEQAIVANHDILPTTFLKIGRAQLQVASFDTSFIVLRSRDRGDNQSEKKTSKYQNAFAYHYRAYHSIVTEQYLAARQQLLLSLSRPYKLKLPFTNTLPNQPVPDNQTVDNELGYAIENTSN